MSGIGGFTYNYFPDEEFLRVHPVIVIGFRFSLFAAQADVKHRDGNRRLCRDICRVCKCSLVLFCLPILQRCNIVEGCVASLRMRLAYEVRVIGVEGLWPRTARNVGISW
jgi:hypothetical protein